MTAANRIGVLFAASILGLAVLAAATAPAIGADLPPDIRPMILAEKFTNPSTSMNGIRIRYPQGCPLVIGAITDTRIDRRTLGTIAGRPIRAPANMDVWLRNVAGGLGPRGMPVSFASEVAADPDALVAHLTLKVLWAVSMGGSKTASTRWHLRLQRGDQVLADENFRGYDITANWASEDLELQRMMDRTLGRALDQIAAEARKHCPRAGQP